MDQTVEEKLAELLRKAESDHKRYEAGQYDPAFEEWRPGLGWPEFYALYMLRYGEVLVGLQIVQRNDEE